MKINIDIACAACGSNRLRFPPDGAEDEAVVCEDCGHELASFAEVKRRVDEAVQASIQSGGR